MVYVFVWCMNGLKAHMPIRDYLHDFMIVFNSKLGEHWTSIQHYKT